MTLIDSGGLYCIKLVIFMCIFCLLVQLACSAKGLHVLHVQGAIHQQFNGNTRISHRARDCSGVADGCQFSGLLGVHQTEMLSIFLVCYRTSRATVLHDSQGKTHILLPCLYVCQISLSEWRQLVI